MEGEGVGNFITWSTHDSHMSSCLLSTAKWHTRQILHSLLATKMGQVPAESYTKRMKHTQAKSHDSERLQSDKREIPSSDTIIWWSEMTALFGVAPLKFYHSHPSAVKLRTRICFTGRTYLSSGFSSFSVTVTMNVNKLLCLESMTSAVPQITWWNSPGLLPPFLHTGSDQKLEA